MSCCRLAYTSHTCVSLLGTWRTAQMGQTNAILLYGHIAHPFVEFSVYDILLFSRHDRTDARLQLVEATICLPLDLSFSFSAKVF